ncbi:MAG: hypothetical protein WCJ64_23120 [Rhodospirillaceae bacterium]
MQASYGVLPFQTSEVRPSARSAPRGAFPGHALNFEPAPPKADVLRRPLTVEKLPAYQVPRDGIFLKLSSLLGSLGWSSRGEQNQLTQARSATAIVMGSLSPRIARELEESGWLAQRETPTGGVRVGAITHPYALMDAFRTLVRLSDQKVVKERRFLELVLAMVLRQYLQDMGDQTLIRFSFEAEAREHFLRSVRIERALKKVADKNTRQDLLQQLHDCYYNAKNYYLFSVISREKAPADGKLFMMYCHAAHSLARLNWDGSLLEHAHVRRLPTRGEVLFLFRRDRGVQERCAKDADVAGQIKALIASFPE